MRGHVDKKKKEFEVSVRWDKEDSIISWWGGGTAQWIRYVLYKFWVWLQELAASVLWVGAGVGTEIGSAS